MSACIPKAVSRTPIVAHAIKGEEGTKVRFHPIEEFKWSGVGLGRPKEAGDHIHPKGSLTDSPEPEAFGETGLSKERTNHGGGNTPVGFKQTILRLKVKWNGIDTDTLRQEQLIGGPPRNF